MSIQITEIKVLPVDGGARLKAYVNVTLDGCFIIKDMKIIENATGFFLAMPSKKMKDGTYRDIFHPLDKLTKRMLEELVMAEFNRAHRRNAERSFSGIKFWPKKSF